MSHNYDVIVLGVGGMGSAACFELARRGRRVLGLEQFPLAHDRGSSHGHTRIIRQAYYENPAYVPLVQRAYERWFELEQLTGRHLLTGCGCLTVGPPGGELVTGVKRSAALHRLAVTPLTAGDVERHFPAFRVPHDMEAVLEPTAGFLYVEDCVRAHCDAAVSLGAEIHAEEPVREWRAVNDGVEVRTDRGTYSAARLVVTAGPWATTLLRDIGVPLAVMRQVLLWFRPADAALFRRDRFPIFLVDDASGAYYGLPMVDGRGVKLARHYGAEELPTPDLVDREAYPADGEAVRPFVQRYLPAADGPLGGAQVCLYTLTPDRHFVLDTHPRHPQVAVACGFSGHGFKFASAVGEVLADLAETGATRQDTELFRAGRFLGLV